jgi:hypothetical protein
MAQDPRKRQQKLQKKATKRKSRQQDLVRAASRLMMPSLRKAGEWPLHEVILNERWNHPQTLTSVVVARRSPNGYIATGNFLVDRGCLGVKNAFGKLLDETEYRSFVRQLGEHQDLIQGDVHLAAKIVRDAVAYGRRFGFQPNRDTPQAMYVLGNVDPDLCTIDIPLGGGDGKPFYFAGPYDDVDRIMAKLTKAVGADGFNYVLPLADPEFFEDDDDFLNYEPGPDSVEFDDE